MPVGAARCRTSWIAPSISTSTKPTNTLLPEQANFNTMVTEADVQGGLVPAERAGLIRYARQRLGVVRRYAAARGPKTAPGRCLGRPLITDSASSAVSS